MVLSHQVGFYRKKIVRLLEGRSFHGLPPTEYFLGYRECSHSKSALKMFSVKELTCICCSALCFCKSLQTNQVIKERSWFFILSHKGNLPEKDSWALLIHDCVDAFKSRHGSTLLPPVTDSWHFGKASTSAGLAKLINCSVRSLGYVSFHRRRLVV